MFNIGYRTIYQKDIRFAIKEAKKNDFKVIEIHLTSPQFSPFKYSLKELKLIKYFAAREDIILQVHAPLEQSLIFTNKQLRIGAKRQLEEMIKFGRNLGVKCLTLHPGKAAIYHFADGKKVKDDDVYPKFYGGLFEDSIKHIVSIVPKDFFVCIENTDNFTSQYQKVLNKYLPSGKLFLTWDIRKNYSYKTNKLIKEQWGFIQRNKDYVKNLHVSGFSITHGEIKGWEKRLDRFIGLFGNRRLSLIIEIMPLKYALEAKKIIIKTVNRLGQ
ncbi:MAG: TIM barrel protein [Patescibacteria group bacterium]|jgi:hypothetical protein